MILLYQLLYWAYYYQPAMCKAHGLLVLRLRLCYMSENITCTDHELNVRVAIHYGSWNYALDLQVCDVKQGEEATQKWC